MSDRSAASHRGRLGPSRVQGGPSRRRTRSEMRSDSAISGYTTSQMCAAYRGSPRCERRLCALTGRACAHSGGATPRAVELSLDEINRFGSSPTRTRTWDMVINSHPLYQLSYRGRRGPVFRGCLRGCQRFGLPRPRLRAIDWGPLPEVRADVVEDARTRFGRRGGDPGPHRRPPKTPRMESGRERAVAANTLLGVALWRRRFSSHSPDGLPATLLDALLRQLESALESPAPPPG